MAIDASTPITVVSGSSNPANVAAGVSKAASSGIADNFQSFLMLLTTQLQHQNPLEPLDTNQFTQQLVQFAGVEQQLKSNDQLKSLVEMQKATQATQALSYVGHTVAVDGSTATLGTSATWNMVADKTATATIKITNSVGQTVFTGDYTLNEGKGTFVWDGKGNDGTQWPKGEYTMTATAQDMTGKTVAISTEVQGVVDAVDLTSSPALLTIGGATYTVDQVRRVVRPIVLDPPTSTT